MSTSAPTPTAPAAAPSSGQQEVIVISHSSLFYWWPVWAVGFLMAILTWVEGQVMAVVPEGTKADIVKLEDGEERKALVLPAGKSFHKAELKPSSDLPQDPHLHVSPRKSIGVVFSIVLLLVIFITNVPLRGMWSVVVIITLVLISVIFALAGWWDNIIAALSILDVRIDLQGYLLISTVLFVIWLICLLFFDRQTYIIFTPRQFKVCTEIGSGEKVYDNIGMTLERQRGDLFRHLFLGLGSGDLIVKTTGAQAHHFDLPNVLFISSKVQRIEALRDQTRVGEKASE
jgi:hypothetical protein